MKTVKLSFGVSLLSYLLSTVCINPAFADGRAFIEKDKPASDQEIQTDFAAPDQQSDNQKSVKTDVENKPVESEKPLTAREKHLRRVN